MRGIRTISIIIVFLSILIALPGSIHAGNIEAQLPSSDGSDAFQVQDSGGTALMRVRSDGNVGIGTTSPGAKLHVAGFGNVLKLSGSAVGDSNIATLSFYDSNNTLIGYVGDSSSQKSGIEIGAVNGNVLLLGNNVGIGKWSPEARLDIEMPNGENGVNMFMLTSRGNSNTDSGQMLFLHSRSDGARQNTAAIRWETTDGTDGNLSFHTAAGGSNALTERVIIDNSGKVGIGTTTPGYPLHMSSGAHVTAGGVWTNASSREYKENIKDLTTEEAMAALGGLNPTRFNYKVDKEDEYLGFVSEDVPELVATKDRKGLSPMDIVAVLTKVVQTQQEQIKTQQAHIESLSEEIRRMRAGQ